MIGAVVLRLQADNAASLSAGTGRLLHAAFFSLLKDISPELAGYVHEQMNIKPFTIAELQPLTAGKCKFRGQCQASRGDIFDWRLTLLDELLLKIVIALPPGTKIQVGRLSCHLTEIIADGSLDSGLISPEELIIACQKETDIQKLFFKFCSPVSFKSTVTNEDVTFPLPQLVFNSLAMKWQQAQMPLIIDRQQIMQVAEAVKIDEWEGKTRRVFSKADRGTMGVIGNFTYNIRELPVEDRQLLLLLAQFANLSGVGRLTAQGFGQTRTAYE